MANAPAAATVRLPNAQVFRPPNLANTGTQSHVTFDAEQIRQGDFPWFQQRLRDGWRFQYTPGNGSCGVWALCTGFVALLNNFGVTNVTVQNVWDLLEDFFYTPAYFGAAAKRMKVAGHLHWHQVLLKTWFMDEQLGLFAQHISGTYLGNLNLDDVFQIALVFVTHHSGHESHIMYRFSDVHVDHTPLPLYIHHNGNHYLAFTPAEFHFSPQQDSAQFSHTTEDLLFGPGRAAWQESRRDAGKVLRQNQNARKIAREEAEAQDKQDRIARRARGEEVRSPSLPPKREHKRTEEKNDFHPDMPTGDLLLWLTGRLKIFTNDNGTTFGPRSDRLTYLDLDSMFKAKKGEAARQKVQIAKNALRATHDEDWIQKYLCDRLDAPGSYNLKHAPHPGNMIGEGASQIDATNSDHRKHPPSDVTQGLDEAKGRIPSPRKRKQLTGKPSHTSKRAKTKKVTSPATGIAHTQRCPYCLQQLPRGFSPPTAPILPSETSEHPVNKGPSMGETIAGPAASSGQVHVDIVDPELAATVVSEGTANSSTQALTNSHHPQPPVLVETGSAQLNGAEPLSNSVTFPPHAENDANLPPPGATWVLMEDGNWADAADLFNEY